MGRKIAKVFFWLISVPWVFALPFGVVACGSAILGQGGAGWWWGWGIGLGILAALVTAGVVNEKVDEALDKKTN